MQEANCMLPVAYQHFTLAGCLAGLLLAAYREKNLPVCPCWQNAAPSM